MNSRSLKGPFFEVPIGHLAPKETLNYNYNDLVVLGMTV
jgi:hypothetical protein